MKRGSRFEVRGPGLEERGLSFTVAVAMAVCVLGVACGGELETAREALRDGLWEVAREHARNIDGEDARRIIVESYAREGTWADVLEYLGAGDEPKGVFAYWKALALVESGEKEKAHEVLENADFGEGESVRLAAGLKARLAVEAGDSTRALKFLKESAFDSADATSRLAAADILMAAGDEKGAAKIWREVAAMKDAPPSAVALAAANLKDATLLRVALAAAKDSSSRRLAGLRLGTLLIADNATFDEGAKMIRSIVKDSPDADGAKESALALADRLVERGDWQAAADAYGDAMEIWPEEARSFNVLESHAWALRKLGKNEKALEAFVRAGELAKTDEDKARLALEEGDVLSDCGRGEEAMAKYRMVLEKYPASAAADKLQVVVKRRETEAKGRELYREYRFAEAQEVFATMASVDPDTAERAAFFEVLCLYGQGRDDEACEKAKALAAGARNASIKAEATLWLAKYAYNARRWSDSGRMFRDYAAMVKDRHRAADALIWSARAAFAENDFSQAIRIVTSLLEEKFPAPDSVQRSRALIVQAEALMELGRYDEAILVLERCLLEPDITSGDRLKAEVLRADSLFALGADNAERYIEALDAYRAVRLGESLPPGPRLAVSFKMGRTLEKLKRNDEAIDQYYTGVVLAYREGRQKGVQFDDEARAAFSRAAFRLADEYESRGKDFQAMHILELVVASDVPAADEAEKRLERIQTKGKFL